MASVRIQAKSPAGTDRQRGAGSRKRAWIGKAIHGVKRLLAMFLYLWILFGLFLLHESIVLAQHGISFTRYGVGFVNAWILAKVMLVAEDLNIARGFEGKPLVYPILYKSVVFGVVFLCFGVAEEVLIGLWRGKTLSDSIPAIGGGSPLGILSLTLIFSFALIPYFSFREVGRAIGEGELRALLFTRAPKPDAAGPVAPAAQPSATTPHPAGQYSGSPGKGRFADR